jgi:hypothetical protein
VRFGDTSRLDTRTQNVLIGWHVFKRSDTIDRVKVAVDQRLARAAFIANE